MPLPQNEKELRLLAIEVLEEALIEISEKGGGLPPKDLPIYTLQHLKALGVWVARQGIRKCCPHIPKEEAERYMHNEFEGVDRPL